jgi:sarcosine oxidase subunit gamma
MVEQEPKRLLTGQADALRALVGWSPPSVPNTTAQTRDGLCLWLAPDRWLLLGESLIQHRGSSAVLDVSSRWSTFSVGADTLAAGCSLDLRSRTFAVGRCAQTRIEQVPVIVYRCAADAFDVLVERPLAHHLGLWLEEVSK